jgi:formylmethanofuran dehydrogenase subunit A
MATFVQISAKLRRVDLVVPINTRRTHNKFNEFPIVNKMAQHLLFLTNFRIRFDIRESGR